MTQRTPKLTQQEQLFCQLSALLGNSQEAAIKAGYPAGDSGRAAALLLQRPEIRRQVRKCAKRQGGGDLSEATLSGLARLALGSHADGVCVALLEEAPTSSSLAEMDLFCVSEVKRPKGGGCEVKFYDRLSALELLLRAVREREETAGAQGLLEALRNSAAGAPEEDGEEDAL